MPEREAVRILLVEDHALLREVLARSLEQEPGFEVVGQCAGVDVALDLIRDNPVDLVLLDINLGSEQGGSFLPRSRAAGFEGKILVLTAGIGNREAAWLLKRGCDGIFLKHETPVALVTRIREVMSGASIKTESETEILAQVGRAERPRKPLTPRECEVLRSVCQGLSNKEIADRLNISENSVKSFLQQLFKKVGVRTRAQLVAAAIEQYWDQLERT